MVFGGKELLEMDPGFVNLDFAPPLLAGFIVKTSELMAWYVVCKICSVVKLLLPSAAYSTLLLMRLKYKSIGCVESMGSFICFLHSLTTAGVIFPYRSSR